jgi:transposase InsO family protein
LIAEAQIGGARLNKACAIVGISLRTYQRWNKSSNFVDQRKGASKYIPNKLSELERNLVINVVNKSEFSSLPPSQIVPILADRGEYVCSESTFYRILRAEGMQHHRGRSKPPQKKDCPRLTAYQPNQIYSWDITFLPTNVKGKFYYLYLFIDIYSRFIVGWHINIEQNNKISAVIFQQICESENIKPTQLTLHADNGGPMKGSTMLATMQNLGVIKSFSRPATSNDNPFSEALFKTVKYCPSYPRKPFKDIEQAEIWMAKFTSWYNFEHKHSGIKFVTPYQRHAGLEQDILDKRVQLYERAKKSHPNRWASNTRCWKAEDVVHINPILDRTKELA